MPRVFSLKDRPYGKSYRWTAGATSSALCHRYYSPVPWISDLGAHSFKFGIGLREPPLFSRIQDPRIREGDEEYAKRQPEFLSQALKEGRISMDET